MQFFACYRFHEDHAELDSKAIVDYLEQRDDARARTWNLAIAGSTASRRTVGGQMIDLGQAELSLPEPVNMINRARMAESPRPDTADLKAIMSRPDRFLDVDPALLRPPLPADEAGLTQLREELTDGRGLLILYPISPHSVPMGATRTAERPTREALDALAPIVGVGVIFPTATASTLEAEYVGLELGGVEVDEDEVLVDERAMADAERDIVVDGADFVSEQQ